MDRYRDLGLLILRVGFGLAFVWYHGYPKLAGGPEMWARIGDALWNIDRRGRGCPRQASRFVTAGDSSQAGTIRA
jgi:hypothetical protein